MLTFDECLNYGKVESSAQRAGGFIGQMVSQNAVSVIDCGNFGVIGNGQAGAIIGFSQAFNGTNPGSVTIQGFLNMGSISSTNAAGGLIGYTNINGTVTGTYTIDACANFGSVTGKQQVGGFVGLTSGGVTITNSLSAGSVKVNDTSVPGIFAGVADKASGSGNYHISTDGANTDCTTDENALQDINAAIEKYNDTSALSANWGKAMLNDAGNGAVLATPKFAGVQNTAVTKNDENEDVYSIRLISVINAARYSKVGYNIQVSTSTTSGSELPIYCTTAYTAIEANDNGVKKTYTAAELGGLYVYALKIENLDPTETYTFKITPIAVGTEADGAAEYLGETYVITYTNGVYSGCTVVENAEV